MAELTYLHPAGGGGPGPHAVISAGGYSYDYDANGNMIYGKGKDLTYDAENRLIEVDNLGQITTFEYNHAGNRIKKITSEGSTTYIGKLYEVIDSQGEILSKKHIFTGSDRSITKESTGETYYYHSDHLGSSNIITDDTGTQVQHIEYTPYGLTSRNEGDYNTDYKFTGQLFDNSTDLYYYGARYYDPTLGRFTQADPIVQFPYDPQSLNRYSYCLNNPLRYIDPSGHSIKDWWDDVTDTIQDFFQDVSDVIDSCIKWVENLIGVSIEVNVSVGGTIPYGEGSGTPGTYDPDEPLFTSSPSYSSVSSKDSEVPSGPKESGNTNDIVEQQRVEQSGGSPQQPKTQADKASKALITNPTPQPDPLGPPRVNNRMNSIGKGLERFGSGMIDASTYGGAAGATLFFTAGPHVGLPILAASGTFGWIGLGMKAIGIFVQNRAKGYAY